MFTSRRPSESRWYVDAICAASVGDSSAGRNATRNFTRRVSGISDAVASHASSQPVPHGVSMPSKPSASHATATCARYARSGARRCGSSGSGSTSRASPPVGRNQCNCTPGSLLLGDEARQLLDHAPANVIVGRTELREHRAGEARRIGEQRKQDVLGAHIVVAELECLAYRVLDARGCAA